MLFTWWACLDALLARHALRWSDWLIWPVNHQHRQMVYPISNQYFRPLPKALQRNDSRWKCWANANQSTWRSQVIEQQHHRHNIRRRHRLPLPVGADVPARPPSWMGPQCAPSAFISTEEGVSPTTIISITPRLFTGFSHGLVCYKTGRDLVMIQDELLKNKIIIRIIVQSYLWKVIPRDLVSILRRKLHKILA